VGDISTSTAIQSNIFKLSGHATDLIDAAKLPIDRATCTGVYPHSYLRVNTVFELRRPMVCTQPGQTSTPPMIS